MCENNLESKLRFILSAVVKGHGPLMAEDEMTTIHLLGTDLIGIAVVVMIK